MNKSQKKAVRLSKSLATLVATAGVVGFTAANAFEAGVNLASKLKGSDEALKQGGTAYKAGYVARRLKDSRKKQWGNMSDEQIIAEGAAIYARPYPESSKDNRRTTEEHEACRAADTSWSSCKRRAGIEPTKAGGRRPRPAEPKKAEPEKLARKDASPILESKEAANDFFAREAAALLTAVNRNAKFVTPAISSAVQDLHAAMVKAGLIKPRARKSAAKK